MTQLTNPTQTTQTTTHLPIQTREKLLNTVYLGTFILAALAVLAYSYTVITITGTWSILALYATLVFIQGIFTFKHDIPYKWRALFLVSLTFIVSVVDMATLGLAGDARLWLIVFIIYSIVLFGRTGTISVIISIICLAITGYLQSHNNLPLVQPELETYVSASGWISVTLYSVAIYLMALMAIIHILRDINQSITQEKELTHALEQERRRLDQNVSERTRAIQATAAVSRHISTLRDTTQLAQIVVNEIQTTFNYYYVQIYLMDEAGKTLHLFGGTGEAGQKMLEKGHHIPLGQGIVGHAAATNQLISVPNVYKFEDWLPNPLLPSTRSEIAIPITIGQEVLGVLDVQQNIIGGFSQEDTNMLQSIASQVAIVLRNARLYSQAQERARQEAILTNFRQKLQQATNIEQVLELTARELGQVLATTHARVELKRPQSSAANRT